MLFDLDDNYGWHENGCGGRARFICAECKGVLHKYIASDSWVYGDGSAQMNYSQARYFCENVINTSLASLHSESDFQQAREVCIDFDKNYQASCWIGLNDLETLGIYEWEDGTEFNYANNISGGVHPWDKNDPNIELDYERCVLLLAGTDFFLSDYKCSTHTWAVCNMPSELCTSEWLEIEGH